jgi:hypothetical protein
MKVTSCFIRCVETEKLCPEPIVSYHECRASKVSLNFRNTISFMHAYQDISSYPSSRLSQLMRYRKHSKRPGNSNGSFYFMVFDSEYPSTTTSQMRKVKITYNRLEAYHSRHPDHCTKRATRCSTMGITFSRT